MSTTNDELLSTLLDLKPIGDLAKNFDLDISSCLQEYMDELASVTHQLPFEIAENLQKHSSQMNFARAALVLQNSSSIYSRKVEYLHTLVYEALHSLKMDQGHELHVKQRGNLSRGNLNSRTDPDIDAFEAFDLDLEFLPLDKDILPMDDTGELINLNEEEDDHNNYYPQQYPHGRRILDMNMTSTTMTLEEHGQKVNLSAGNLGMSITRYDPSTTIQNMTINKESVNSHAANALLRNLLDGNASAAGSDPSQVTLRLMNGACDIADSGALYMPGTGVNYFDGEEEEKEHHYHPQQYQQQDGDDDHCNTSGEKLNRSWDDTRREPMEGIQFDNYHDDGVDDDNDGPGFELNDSRSSDHIQKVVTFAHGTATTNTHAPKATKSTKVDPWALLDPHDVGDSKHKPLHVGNSLRLPHDCEDLPSDTVTGARTKKIPRAKPIQRKEEDYILKHSTYTTECYEATVKASRDAAKRRLSSDHHHDTDENIDKFSSWQMSTKLLTFGDEFQYILKAETKRKNAEKRKLKRLEIEKSGLSSEAIVSSQRFHDMYDDDDDDNDGPGFDLGGDDDHSFGNGFHTQTSNCENGHNDFGGIFGASSNDEYDNGKTFEALCRAHLKEYAKGAEKYAMESQLSKRVDNWQSKVSVVLREEEERPEFDIQSYSNQILSNAQKNLREKSKVLNSESTEMDDQIPFVSVTRDQEPYNVSRLFLASLMLCNTENIKFSGINVGKVTTPDQLCVKILKPTIESHVDDYFGSMIDDVSPVVPQMITN